MNAAGADRAHFMSTALRLAQRGLGNTWPNPAVGCVIVSCDSEPVVLARGWTRPGGRPHAEAAALDDLFRRHGRDAARGAAVYVSLEPCSHHGRTPPCADALVDAGVGRVVIACEDPDPRVSGRGIARLRAAGIDVVVGEQRAAAEDVNAGFFQRVRSGRPLVTWKTATSLDGRIATAAGHARWITGDAARAHAHLERSRHDAILVGIGTALADDPQLTCRLPGMAHRSPVRVVLDSNLRLPATARLAAEAATVPTWLIARDDVADDRSRELRARGVEIIRVPADDGSRPDTVRVLQELAARGVTRLLVEGGAEVAASLIRRSLVDRIDWYRAPMLIGGAGRAATRPFGLARLDAAPRFTRTGLRKLGDDWLETYRRLD